MADYRGVTVLSGDGRTRELKRWLEWLRRVPAIRRKFSKWSDDFDPFHSNEAASVAVLANAASRAGYLAHTEYVAVKRHSTRGRPFRPGRCDLWVADVGNEVSWAFEVKQHFAATGMRQRTFDARLARARKDASQVDPDEADRRVGLLIAVPPQGALQTKKLIQHFDEISASADISFRIGGGVGAIWLAFSFAD